LDALRGQAVPELPVPITYQEVEETNANELPAPITTSDLPQPILQKEGGSVQMVTEMNLAVPFTVQAPTGDWNQPYKDACEEASILMVKEYYAKKGVATIDADAATKEILNIVAFEDTLFGYNADTTIAETAVLAEKMFGFVKSEILVDPTLNELKERLNKGQPIIIPVAGQLLKNPYFTAPGPVYHMAVIRGYTKNNQFIVNDPGTKRGKAFLYSFDTIMNALHDWNGGADILEGKKLVLILHPQK
jgi:hypothetical protein